MKNSETLFSLYSVLIVPTQGDRRSNQYDINQLQQTTHPLYHFFAGWYSLHRRVQRRSSCRNALYQRSPAERERRWEWALIKFGKSGIGRLWPMPSIHSRRAPGIGLAVSIPPSTGNKGSLLPWITKVCAVIAYKASTQLPQEDKASNSNTVALAGPLTKAKTQALHRCDCSYRHIYP